VTSLVSGVGIFCLGAGVSFWHGVQCAIIPHALVADLTLAYATLAFSAIIDSIVLIKVTEFFFWPMKKATARLIALLLHPWIILIEKSRMPFYFEIPKMPKITGLLYKI